MNSLKNWLLLRSQQIVVVLHLIALLLVLFLLISQYSAEASGSCTRNPLVWKIPADASSLHVNMTDKNGKHVFSNEFDVKGNSRIRVVAR